MTNTKFLLHNVYARTIAAITAAHIVLNVFFLHTWWSMIVFLVLSIAPAMRPDLFLTVIWTAEVCTAGAVSFGLLKGHAAIGAFILWSSVAVIVCGMRLFRGKARGDNKT
jgi:hypothetical protein